MNTYQWNSWILLYTYESIELETMVDSLENRLPIYTHWQKESDDFYLYLPRSNDVCDIIIQIL